MERSFFNRLKMIKDMKIRLICVICVLFTLSVNGQRLNELYLQARADMLREQYVEAGQKILSIPARERTSQMYLTLGESFYRSGNYSEAARYFAESDNPEALLYAARACAMMRQPAQATEWLQKYLLQRDKISEIEITLDPAFERIERSREWRDLWDDREWYNVSERRHADAAVLLRRGRHSEALSIIDAEITRASTARHHALRAKVYEAMGLYEPAHESAQAAIRMRNNIPEYFADAASIATRVNRHDVALDNINRAVRLDPYQLELYLQRAAILRMNQRFDEARNDINFYFTYLPGDVKALYQMGRAETEAGNPLAGIEYFTMLIDNDNSNPEYFIARADAGLKSNNLALANHDLSQALDLNIELPEVWHKKGIVLHQENKREDACYYWRRALQMGYREASEFIYRHCIR